MAEKSDEIRDRIDAQRGELGDNLHELERRVKNTTDWRAHMENRPWVMLGIAFGTGVAISGLISRNGSSSDSSVYSGGYSDTARSSSRFTAVREQRSRAAESLDKMTGALIAVGVQKLQDVLRSAIPGFSEKYEPAESSRSSQTGESSYRGNEYDRPQTESYSQAPTPAL